MNTQTLSWPLSLRTRIGAWLRQLVSRFRKPAAVIAPPQVKAEPPPVIEVLPPAEPSPVVEVSADSAELRRLERRRRKHDKFVTPQGVAPKTRPRTQEIKPKPRPVEVIVETNNTTAKEMCIADHHHEDSEKVLYKETELFGEFNFRDTILQQLDRYFVYLARMKKNNPDAYGLYRQVGATILPYMATGAYDIESTVKKRGGGIEPEDTPLPEWFNATRPAFGCFVYGANPETEKFESSHRDKHGRVCWVPKFMYYTKYNKPPPELQLIAGGDIYKLTVWWDRPFDPKMKNRHGTPQEFGIFISRDGKQIVALRQLDTRWVSVRPKRGADRDTFYIPQRGWRIPSAFEDWAKEQGKDVQRLLTGLFLWSVQKQALSLVSMVRVSVSKDDMTAVFGVNHKRMSYFFQDRDYQLTEGGTRKKVFHIVRPHARAGGAHIKFHFRGEREFTWAGYKVLITVPGRDHLDLNEFDVGAVDEYWGEKGEKYFDMPAIGKAFADNIKHDVPPSEMFREGAQ